jgi:alkane 1-monooxygenase
MHALPSPKPSAWRFSECRFLVIWLLPLSALAGTLTRPDTAFVSTLLIWWGIALVDHLWPGAQHSPAARRDAAWLIWLLRLYVPIQVALLAVGLWVASGRGPNGDLSWAVVLGLAFAVGFVTGSEGITFAHELGHSRRKTDRVLGWALMTSVTYAHFMVEHYRGHHPRAATWDDPASARYGEGFWRFLPRTLWGSLAHAWQLEA